MDLNSSHGVVYQAPVGRGYSADDLQGEERRVLAEKLNETLPGLLDEGTSTYVAQIKQEQLMKELEQKLAQCMNPDNARVAKDMFRARAIDALKPVPEPKPAEEPAKVAEPTVREERKPKPRS